jgi:hypothetical protein
MPATAASAIDGLRAACRAAGLAVALRLHRNRTIALSLRGRPGAWRLGLHHDLLDDGGFLLALPDWIAAGGRGRHPGIAAGLRRLGDAQREQRRLARGPEPACAPIGSAGLDLPAELARIHRTWFADLSLPDCAWARASYRRRQRCIRYGSYRRRPAPLIRLHPRLGEPWIARAFVEHVLFHELCHHRQALVPLRGERPHSPRFRAWERSFPQHAEAMAWERYHRDRLLGRNGAPSPGVESARGPPCLD